MSNVQVRQHMEALGWRQGEDLYYYLDRGGMHNEKFWGARAWAPLEASNKKLNAAV